MSNKKITISKKVLAEFSAQKAVKQIDQTCKSIGMNKVERILILDSIARATINRYEKMGKNLSSKQQKALKKALKSKKITKIART